MAGDTPREEATTLYSRDGHNWSDRPTTDSSSSPGLRSETRNGVTVFRLLPPTKGDKP